MNPVDSETRRELIKMDTRINRLDLKTSVTLVRLQQQVKNISIQLTVVGTLLVSDIITRYVNFK